MTAHPQKQDNSPAVQETEGGRKAAALNMLLNNPEIKISPPIPVIDFAPLSDENTIAYTGALSASQYDRLHYIAQVTGMSLQVTSSQDHAEARAFHVTLSGGKREALDHLVQQEPQRRMRSKEMETLLRRATGLEWCWDGLCMSTPYPHEEHPAHSILQGFREERVTQTPYDISVFRSDASAGSMTDWLSIHNCDLVRLRLMSQKTGRPEMGFGR